MSQCHKKNGSETITYQMLMRENWFTEILRNCGLKIFTITITNGNTSARKANAVFGFGKLGDHIIGIKQKFPIVLTHVAVIRSGDEA